jgi:hypothetical protein
LGGRHAPRPKEAEPATSKLERATEALRRYANEATLEERMRIWLREDAEALARVVLEA